MKRGEIRWCTMLSPDKRRPVLILTRNPALSFLNSVTVAPLTSTVRNIPTQILLSPGDDGVESLSAINLDNVQTVPKHTIEPFVTTLSPERMRSVDEALCFALGADRTPNKRTN
jgi:mRNA interferase MazF